jgi:hypothetical protein
MADGGNAMMAYALRNYRNHLHTKDVTRQTSITVLEERDRDGVRMQTRKGGWARRPKQGKMYGAKYIKLYQADIKVFFEEGVKEKSRKMGAAAMLQALKEKYSDACQLPSEIEIRHEISKLLQAQKDPQSNVQKRGRQPRIKIPMEVEEFIKGKLNEDVNTKPKAIYALVRDKFTSTTNNPDGIVELSEQTIMNKINSLKRIIKSNYQSQK